MEGQGRWQAVVGHGRPWKAVESRGRPWKVAEGRGRSRKALGLPHAQECLAEVAVGLAAILGDGVVDDGGGRVGEGQDVLVEGLEHVLVPAEGGWFGLVWVGLVWVWFGFGLVWLVWFGWFGLVWFGAYSSMMQKPYAPSSLRPGTIGSTVSPFLRFSAIRLLPASPKPTWSMEGRGRSVRGHGSQPKAMKGRKSSPKPTWSIVAILASDILSASVS